MYSVFFMCLLLSMLRSLVTNAQTCGAGETFNEQHGSFAYSDDSIHDGGFDRALSWKITAPPRQQLSIVIDNFITPTCTNATTCTCAFLAIRDGECNNSRLLGRYCGAQIDSPRFSSSGRHLRLEFVSKGRKITKIKGHFTVSYSRVTTCYTWRSQTHKCPNANTKLSHNECCIMNGRTSCCFLGRRNCTDKGMYRNRSYCPRPHDDASKTVCCIVDNQPSCCESGGNHCNDKWMYNRSYCPSTDEEKMQGSVICCSKEDRPSCCSKPAPQIHEACRPFGKDWAEGTCIFIWILVAGLIILAIVVAVLVWLKWTCYHCLAYAIVQCWPMLYERIRTFFRYLSFAVSLVVTTLCFTLVCCPCFACFREWPWKAAYRIVSRKFGIGAEYMNVQ
ncbi:uncharacterized protein LOC114536779 isoform X2 [Dendronephthya gigantea]|uniref:uncharacterized protein LOC114536779 isoform X2 n=1 Tax=Dendronephthya gigantea TaxID=151771 RepID=UPI00106BFC7B|nr:uncharacterized protein LOC114536779 isoform X2 [Dendronephthya gigantea]